MTFGNGAPWTDYTRDERLTLDEVRSLAKWFVVLRPVKPTPASSHGFDHADVTNPDLLRDDPTGTPDVVLPRTPSGSFQGASSEVTAELVFRVKRKPQAQFDFISVGRNENNDIFLPDASVSRFHAFFRETPEGLTLQDAKSSNGTLCRGERVPQQGVGKPVVVASGDAIRFGDIHGTVLSAEALFAKARTSRR